jgi:membrane-bound lytic murein transglycosylase A
MCTLLFRLGFFAAAIASIIVATTGAVDARQSPSRPSDKPAATQAATKLGEKIPGDKAHPKPGARQVAEPLVASTSRVRPRSAPEPLRIPDAALEPTGWGELDGWSGDDHASAFATFQASCRPIVRSQPLNDGRPVRAALQTVCARALKTGPLGSTAARKFFEDNFLPIRIRKLGDAAGFLTGYYEPIVDGSRFPTREFTVPLYRRPPDLLAAGATQPGGPFPNSGRAFRRTTDGELVPYYDRGEIEDGALDGRRLEICWLRSATDALFIQIQGSARVRLEDGTLLRLNYDAHNGYPYMPVGRVLIDRNIIPREEMSMHRIREWMQANPDDAKDVRRQNRSVVFFRIVGLNDDREPLGAQGIRLSAGRSIAVDKALHVYGTPFFIEADLPLASANASTPFRRTMIAQDTGSAIVGPARADLYFGAGDEAGQIAGRVRQPGQFALLLPRDLDPVAAGTHMPLPPVRRPASPATGQRPPPAGTTGRDRLESKSEPIPVRFERGHASRRLVR